MKGLKTLNALHSYFWLCLGSDIIAALQFGIQLSHIVQLG